MAAVIRYESRPTFRDLQGRFARAEKELLNIRRDEMRAEGRELRDLVQSEAPEGETGEFKKGITFKTFQRGDVIVLTIGIPMPLGKFIREGTKPHTITAKNARALRFEVGGQVVVVPKGGGFKSHYRDGVLWSGKGFVDHPGTKPNDFLKRGHDKWLPRGEKALNRISTRWQQIVVS